MKPFLITLLLAVCYWGYSQQLYDKSGGIRLGNTSGLTYKNFVTESEAFELMLSGRNNGLQFTTLYLFHAPLVFSFNDRFYVHYGIGGHVGFEKFDDIAKEINSEEGDSFVYVDQTYFVMGADGNIGIEYRWLEVPITIGFDIKPYINYIGMRQLRARFWDAAISFKYAF